MSGVSQETPTQDRWKGWERDDKCGCWKRGISNEDGHIAYGMVHLYDDGNMAVFGRYLPIGDVEACRDAAYGLVRGRIRWMDEVKP